MKVILLGRTESYTGIVVSGFDELINTLISIRLRKCRIWKDSDDEIKEHINCC